MSTYAEHGDLSPDDERLLDALVEAGFDPAAVPVRDETERRRLEALRALFELLDDYPVEDVDDSLVHATLARVDRAEQAAAGRLVADAGRVDPGPRSGWRIRVPDFISIAAVFLIATSVVLPVMSHVRRARIDSSCAQNLRLVGQAFEVYAGDYEGAMPVVAASLVPRSWAIIRNSENLEPLLDGSYCRQRHLDCPGNHDQETSYSYQWQDGGGTRLSQMSGSLLLGDRNPLVAPARKGNPLPPLSISLNHGGRGQNVLSGDGSLQWLIEPLHHGHDNIWLPQGVRFLRREDSPTDLDDVFLVH